MIGLEAAESVKTAMLRTMERRGPDANGTFQRDDVACKNKLTVCSLNSEALGLTVTAVLGRTNTLFVSKKLNV